ncbi:sulfite exporter TauE/SafE family protein [Engelhardtia mirabilis]|uniref:Urease accessory protein UreH-like transmembrane domain-containing protein n=1 Tax=Engelhardtia mirabilis TaxID=2528011 RepID=A0A518BIH8_9BACT|nr:hypothetical protein Pla133_18630 [Planctomycetes bacterium Pla133]QDV01113.1 hypothetical protein Pla86_18620 [Planctomycetes bacterium Pla86]
MWELTLAVALASLLGSVHCAAMCGPFVALLARPGERRLPADLAYQAGRLASYVALGALAGGMGAALDLSGAIFGLQRAALVIAGAGLVLFGLVSLARNFGWRIGFGHGGRLARLARGLQVRAAKAPPRRRALFVGLATGLLPCGWLYAFVLSAAATGDALHGALTMAAFWFGALPALSAVGLSARRLLGPMQRRAPAVGALALVALGLVALSGRFRVPALSAQGGRAGDQSALGLAEEAALATPSCCAADGDAVDG